MQIIIFREFLVSGLREYSISQKQVHVNVTSISKINALQYCTIRATYQKKFLIIWKLKRLNIMCFFYLHRTKENFI